MIYTGPEGYLTDEQRAERLASINPEYWPTLDTYVPVEFCLVADHSHHIPFVHIADDSPASDFWHTRGGQEWWTQPEGQPAHCWSSGEQAISGMHCCEKAAS